MQKSEKIIVSILLVAAILSSSIYIRSIYISHSVPAPAHGGSYTEGMVGQPRLINSIIGTSAVDNAISRLVFSSLYTYSASGELIPDLATEMPKISADQKEYTVTLKENALWHNQKPVTADDVIFTIETIQNPAYKSPYRNNWLNTSVKKNNDREITFINKDISAPFVHNLTLPIMSSAIWSNVSASNFPLSELNLEAVGSGPYQINEITKLPNGDINKISFIAFSKYYNGKAYISSFNIRFYSTLEEASLELENNNIDALGYNPLSQTEQVNVRDAKKITIASGQYQALFFNTTNKFLSDPNIRIALSKAVNKDLLISEVYKDEAVRLDGPILPEQLGYTNTASSVFTPGEAASLLDDAGWTLDPNGIRSKKQNQLTITLYTNDSQINIKTSEFIANSWNALGIKTEIKSLATRDLTEQVVKPRSFDVLVFGQRVGADPDAFAFWHGSQIKDPGLNVSGFADNETDELLSAARSTTDTSIREASYKRFQQIIQDKAPALFLVQTDYIYLNNFTGTLPTFKVLFDSSYRFSEVHKWYKKEKRVLKF